MKKKLNVEDKQFLSNMEGNREGEVSSLDRVTMAKSKRKMDTVLQIQERKHREKKLSSEVISSTVIEKYEDSESNLSSNAGEDPDLYLPKPSKKRKKERKQKSDLSSASVLIQLSGAKLLVLWQTSTISATED